MAQTNLSQTNFHGPRGVRAIEVLLYLVGSSLGVLGLCFISFCFFNIFFFGFVLNKSIYYVDIKQNTLIRCCNMQHRIRIFTVCTVC